MSTAPVSDAKSSRRVRVVDTFSGNADDGVSRMTRNWRVEFAENDFIGMARSCVTSSFSGHASAAIMNDRGDQFAHLEEIDLEAT